MCNAFTHSDECRCGFGGEGHKGRGGGGGDYRREFEPTYEREFKDVTDCCGPAKCPICRDSVYFIRHNGGSVWVDELGWPWPIHACFPRIGEKLPFLRPPAGKALRDLWPAVIQRAIYDPEGTKTAFLVRRVQDGKAVYVQTKGNSLILVGEFVLLSHSDSILFSTRPEYKEVLFQDITPSPPDGQTRPRTSSIYRHNYHFVRSLFSQEDIINRFTKNQGGTVTDTQTGLTWTSKNRGEAIPYNDVIKYYAYKGSGWRLPTKQELLDLYETGFKDIAWVKIKNSLAGCLIWASDPVKESDLPSIDTKWKGGSGWAFYTTFDKGGHFVVGRRSSFGVFRALLVKDEGDRPLTIVAPVLMERFVKNENGNVSDTKNRLIWEASDNKADITYENAVNYCEQDGWRMPTKEDLLWLYSAGLRNGISGETKILLTGDEVWAADIFKRSDVPQNHKPERSKLWAFNISFVDGSIRKDLRVEIYLKRALRVRGLK